MQTLLTIENDGYNYNIMTLLVGVSNKFTSQQCFFIFFYLFFFIWGGGGGCLEVLNRCTPVPWIQVVGVVLQTRPNMDYYRP